MSHESPRPSLSVSAWPAFEMAGQLSEALTTPSPSKSLCPPPPGGEMRAMNPSSKPFRIV
jgi:hypothetical protein